MYVAEKIREPAQVNAVALKAYARVADAWGLSLKEAAGLADMEGATVKGPARPAEADILSLRACGLYGPGGRSGGNGPPSPAFVYCRHPA